MMHGVPQQPIGIRQRVPILGQQQQPNQDQMARMQIMQAVHAMSSGLYVQLAAAHIATRDPGLDQDVDEEHLRNLAAKCMTAAKAYFEGLGMIQSE